MVFFTAEIGINHNGDLEIAKKLIDVAVEAGCDAVKFQKRTVEKVYSKEVLDTPRESPWGKTTREQKLGLEFGKDEYLEIPMDDLEQLRIENYQILKAMEPHKIDSDQYIYYPLVIQIKMFALQYESVYHFLYQDYDAKEP